MYPMINKLFKTLLIKFKNEREALAELLKKKEVLVKNNQKIKEKHNNNKCLKFLKK